MITVTHHIHVDNHIHVHVDNHIHVHVDNHIHVHVDNEYLYMYTCTHG